MAKAKDSTTGFVTTTAEAVGGTLGTIAGTVDRLKAEHPHPVTETKAALVEGQAAVSAAARSTVADVRKAASKTQREGRNIVRRVKRAARKTVKRGKKIVGRAKKAAARARKRARR